MSAWTRKSGAVCVLLAGLFAGCRPDVPVEELPDAARTMRDVGRRLGASLSETRLTELAARGPALLAFLDRAERDALGRAYLRFRVDRPVAVAVAAPPSSVPFWIRDRGFIEDGDGLEVEGSRWSVYRKDFPAGWIGLGVNGLDRSPAAHYVAFVRAKAGSPPLEAAEVELSEDCRQAWRLVVAGPGVSASSDLRRPIENLPRGLQGAVALQPAHDGRHSTVLATGRVWKTHVPSSGRPDQVTLAYGADPAHELVWGWRTAPEVQRSMLRLVAARFESAEPDENRDPDLSSARVIEGTSRLLDTSNVLNDPLVRRHSVEVKGLQEDTVYLYSLGDGSAGGWGPWRATKTAKGRPGRLEFLYMGDAQTGLEDWGKRLMAAHRRHPGIEFVLLAGDLVDRGNERTNWDHFFLRARDLFDRVPVMPCVGNHEYLDRGPQLYRANFALPRNGPAGIDPGLVYHFEAGNAFIAVLDSTLAVSDPASAELQARWLDEALARTRAGWKIVMFHHPVYPSHPWRDSPNLRERWVPIMDRHRVDLVLQGHDHAYLRTYPMRGNRRASASEEGTVYVVSVAGDKFVDQPPRDYIEVGFTGTSTYQTIEIDDVTRKLTYRSWTGEGEQVDGMVLSRRAEGRLEEIASEGTRAVE
ncbi:Calcineurin-like phosphoesterase [Aquisphaera giovannonii]|uniref:Calcineurin-like phosphoesterase n=1 Tax=Aquisphaera giovannonii TaxID=406548 RepID=A0A5B9WAQ7_9BACT|nr:metallophosphoesterase family protein [Aquisphaera giovannonii]QEH37185.1 Calcineurin-like phosphoesterase [Aquisphaera giovannonii]